jgi:hypothetical protein
VPERLIDVPIESLPFVDEHSTTVSASAEQTWDAVLDVVGHRLGNTRLGRVAVKQLGCIADECRGEPGRIGSTIPGFIVTRSVPPAVLALMGEHRYSRYALVFRITERIGAPLLLSAETRAEFPGRSGAAYRKLVIGTRGHVLATSSLLRGIRRSAEKRAGSAPPGDGP